MAFCPHCGQRTGDQATKCVACGKQIKAAGVAAGPGKFKGTMMMAAPNTKEAIAAARPGSLGQASQAPAASPVKTAAVNKGAANKGAATRQAPKSTQATKKALSGTMVGGMVAPELLAPKAAGAPKAVAPAPKAVAPARSTTSGKDDATAATAPPPKPERPAVRHKASAAAVGDTVVNDDGAKPASAKPALGSPTEPEDYPEETSRVLPGDPMAAFGTEGGQPRPSPSSPRVPLAAERHAPTMLTASHSMDSASGKLWLAVGFAGMLAIAGLGILAAKFMGLM